MKKLYKKSNGTYIAPQGKIGNKYVCEVYDEGTEAGMVRIASMRREYLTKKEIEENSIVIA